MATLQEIVNNVWNSVTGFLKVGGTAAHDAAATGNPVQVGGVYRVADPAVADGDMASLRLNAKGEALVQLTGRSVALTVVYNALAITDTANHFSASIDVSAYKNIQLMAQSTLNQDVVLSLYPNGASPMKAWDGSAWSANTITLVNEPNPKPLNTKWTFLNNSPYFGTNGVGNIFYINAVCAIAPISGSITLLLLGVPN